MILDSLQNALANIELYKAQHSLFEKALEFLKTADKLEDGRYEIVGEDLYAMVVTARKRDAGDADLEAHHNYIDIQMLLTGEESFAWSPLSKCKHIKKEYDAQSDILFYSDNAQTFIDLVKGDLIIFFPSDGHAPLIGEGEVRKVIVKVKVK